MSKKLLLLMLLLAALALAACGRGAAPTPQSVASPTAPVIVTEPVVEPSPTVAPTTVPPTQTPADTAEPEATPTTVVEATATPVAPATPDPNEGVGDLVFEDRMEGRSGWFWGFSDDAAAFALEDGRLKAVMTQPGAWWRFSVGPDGLSVGDQQTRVTAQAAACGSADEYGLIFRGADADGEFDLYVFKLRCDGAAAFEAIRAGKTTTLVDWTYSDAIAAGAGSTNSLLVWAAGSQFRFYVNNEYVFSAEDSTLAAGYFGFYIDDQSSGGLTVLFDDLEVRAVSTAAAQ